jgi:hypothetical protein
MLERAQVRALPLLNKGVDLTPTVQTCCGACRTCVTTNLIGLATAGIAATSYGIGRLAR